MQLRFVEIRRRFGLFLIILLCACETQRRTNQLDATTDSGLVATDAQLDATDANINRLDARADGAMVDSGQRRDATVRVDSGSSVTVAIPGVCPDVATPSSELGYGIFRGTTVGATNDDATGSRTTHSLAGSCRGDPTTGDVAYRWRAPRAGKFLFSVDADYTQMLTIIRGTQCEGSTFECKASLDARANAFSDYESVAITMELAAQEDVVIVVDGNTGYSSEFTIAGNYIVSVLPFDHDVSRFDNNRYAALITAVQPTLCACNSSSFCGADRFSSEQCRISGYQSGPILDASLSCQEAAFALATECLDRGECNAECWMQARAYYSMCPGYGQERNANRETYIDRLQACGFGCPTYTSSSTTLAGEVPITNGNNNVSSCGANTGNDVSVIWTPRATGWWTIYPRNTSYAAHVTADSRGICGYLRSTSNNIQCGQQAPLYVDATANVPMLLAVDAVQPGTGGPFELVMEPYVCSDDPAALVPALQTQMSITGRVPVGAGPFRQCGGAGQQTLVRWQPPAAGTYLLSTQRSATPVVLQKLQRCEFPGAPECSGAATGSQSGSRMVVAAASREPMLLAVQGLNELGGAFTLDFSTQFECSGVTTQLTALTASGNTPTNGATNFRGTCQADRTQVNYLWQAPRSGSIRIAMTSAGRLPGSSVLLLEVANTSNCGATRQLACADGWEGPIRTAASSITASVTAGRNYVITVGTQTPGDPYNVTMTWQ